MIELRNIFTKMGEYTNEKEGYLSQGIEFARYTYGLGKAGERISITEVCSGIETKTTYVYDELNQLITEKSNENQIDYTYDDNGNLVKQIGSKTVDYIYDKENHLIRATIHQKDEVTCEEYTYDYVGNRMSKTINGEDTTVYINDINRGLTKVTATTDKEGRETAYYTIGDERLSM